MTPINEDRRALAFFQKIVWMDYLGDTPWIPAAQEEAEALREIFFNRLNPSKEKP